MPTPTNRLLERSDESDITGQTGNPYIDSTDTEQNRTSRTAAVPDSSCAGACPSGYDETDVSANRYHRPVNRYRPKCAIVRPTRSPGTDVGIVTFILRQLTLVRGVQ